MISQLIKSLINITLQFEIFQLVFFNSRIIKHAFSLVRIWIYCCAGLLVTPNKTFKDVTSGF